MFRRQRHRQPAAVARDLQETVEAQPQPTIKRAVETFAAAGIQTPLSKPKGEIAWPLHVVSQEPLAVASRQAQRQHNKARARSRAIHRARKGHGRQ